MKIIEIQRALIQQGFKPGPLDGIWGRLTIAAVRAFQAKMGLEVDGIVGQQTLAALFPKAKIAAGFQREDIVWFKEAQRLFGTEETPGPASSRVIIDWSTDLGITYKSDDIPWCGLFVGHCIGATLDTEPLPTNVLGARAWAGFGIKTKPTPGAIMVFWRQSLQSGKGHVGFYAGEDDAAYRILGGNQSNKVCYAWINKSRFLAARWPSAVPAPIPESVEVKRTDQPSWNEQ